jgi:hypothetical protein
MNAVMNARAWHVESLRRRAAVGLFVAGGGSYLVDLSGAGVRGLVRLLNPVHEWRLLAIVAVAALTTFGIWRRNSWAEGVGLLLAVGAALMGVGLLHHMSEATETLNELGKPLAVPAWALLMTAGRKFAFATSAMLLLVGQQPGRGRVIAGAAFAAVYLVLVVLDSTLPVPMKIGATP